MTPFYGKAKVRVGLNGVVCFLNLELFCFTYSLNLNPEFLFRIWGKTPPGGGRQSGSHPCSSKGSLPSPKLLSLWDAPAALAHEAHTAPSTLCKPSSKAGFRGM